MRLANASIVAGDMKGFLLAFDVLTAYLLGWRLRIHALRTTKPGTKASIVAGDMKGFLLAFDVLTAYLLGWRLRIHALSTTKSGTKASSPDMKGLLLAFIALHITYKHTSI